MFGKYFVENNIIYFYAAGAAEPRSRGTESVPMTQSKREISAPVGQPYNSVG